MASIETHDLWEKIDDSEKNGVRIQGRRRTLTQLQKYFILGLKMTEKRLNWKDEMKKWKDNGKTVRKRKKKINSLQRKIQENEKMRHYVSSKLYVLKKINHRKENFRTFKMFQNIPGKLRREEKKKETEKATFKA